MGERPSGWLLLTTLPFVLLVTLFVASSSRQNGGSTEPRQSVLAGEAASGTLLTTKSALLPFIPPPKAMVDYVHCILKPGLAIGERKGCCDDFSQTRSPDGIGFIRKFSVVLVNHTQCAALSGFEEEDERTLMYDPVAVYERRGTSDSYALAQVMCLEFDYLELLIPYLPRTRAPVVLDAGANAGYASFLFARFMRFQGELISVEMNPFSARMVRRNTVSLNAVPGFRSVVVNRALVSTTEVEEMPDMQLTGTADGQFLNNRLSHVKLHKGTDYVLPVKSISLPMLLELTPANSFDFIKLDIEGAEHSILNDPASHLVLCSARCVFAELHERYKSGIEDAWKRFVASGCPVGKRMAELVNTGEYSVVCREDLAPTAA